MIGINLAALGIRFSLRFGRKTRRVIHVIPENVLAIIAIFSSVENMLVPKIVHILRRRGDNFFVALLCERIEKAPVLELYIFGVFVAPAHLFHCFVPHGTKIHVADVPFGKQFLKHVVPASI